MILDNFVHLLVVNNPHGIPWHPMAAHGSPWEPMACRKQGIKKKQENRTQGVRGIKILRNYVVLVTAPMASLSLIHI